MWTLENSELPETALPLAEAPICVFDLGVSNPPLAVFDFQSNYQQPGVIVDWVPAETTVIIPPYSGGTVTIDLGQSGLNQVYVVSTSVGNFTPAVNPAAPKPGEFIRQNNSIVLILGGTFLPPAGFSANLIGRSNAQILSNVIDSALGFEIGDLLKTPIIGKISWTLSIEQQPTGQIELVTTGVETGLPVLRKKFKKGSEVILAGIGFSVANFNEKKNVNGAVFISISLTGKWAKPKYNRAVFLKDRGMGASGSGVADKAIDPDCGIGHTTSSSTSSTTGPLTIAKLAGKSDVMFTQARRSPSPLVPMPGDNKSWTIKVPDDTSADATAVWSSEVEPYLRQNGCYISYFNADAVKAIPTNLGKHWDYDVSDIETAFQGDTEHTYDSHLGYAVEYANTALTGRFSEPKDNEKEATPNKKIAKPKWKSRSPKVITLTSGDAEPTQPPPNTGNLKTLSLNWDQSGPTKTLKKITTKDGQPQLEEEFIYGFTYTAIEILNSSGELNMPSTGFWGLVSYKQTQHIYDDQYGYPLGYNTTGRVKRRFKTETDDGLESIAYSSGSPDDQKYLRLYQFRWLPTIERSRSVLHSFDRYYTDVKDDSAYVAYKKCNRDGTSSTEYVRDKTWAPALFVKEELTYTSSLAVIANPDSGTNAADKLPPLITGEETTVHIIREIIPSKNTKPQLGDGFDLSFSIEKLDFDRYIERRIEDSAQGSGFKDKAIHESFTEYDGRPSPASRLPSNYEREEPEPEEGDPNEKKSDSKLYEYTVTTPGWSAAGPSTDSLSYPTDSVGDAVLGAATNLMLKDIQQSVQYSFELPFNKLLRPMDYLAVSVIAARASENLSMRVSSITNTVRLDGLNCRDKFVYVAERSTITAGIDREISMTLNRKERSGVSGKVQPPKPAIPPRPPKSGGSASLDIGDLYDSSLKTRRNF